MKLLVGTVIALSAFFRLSSSAFAVSAGEFIGKYIDIGNCTIEEIAGIFCIVGNVINLLLGLAGGVALVVLVYGGFLYMASGGDQKQLSTAKSAITYAVLGLILILGAILIVETLLTTIAT